MSANRSALAYTFGPLERRGLLGGVGGGRIVTLALGALIAIVSLDRSPSSTGAFAALVACGCAAGVAFVPVGGRCLPDWCPVATAFAARRLRRRHLHLSPVPTAGIIASGVGTRAVGLRTPPGSVPAEFDGVRIVDSIDRDPPIGVLSERMGRRLTAVLACRVGAFTLLDHEAQERRLARWGLVLSGAGGTAVRRLQWIERTAPAQGDALARWLHDERDPELPRGSAMVESYLELISASTRVAQEHEVLLAVQVDARLVRDRGRDAVMRALLESTERVAHGLEAAEVTVLGALGPTQLARTLRTACDPYARAELAALDGTDPERAHATADADADSTATEAWPVGSREAWDHHMCDGALHATYWVSGWPRVDVSPMFMDSLLGHSGTVRTVAVCFEPVAPARSTREVEAAVTRDRADRELRARFGQSETARQRQAAQATLRRESELAAGHGEVRFCGFVTVTGRDGDELRRACSEVLDQAARARLELRRLYGQQARAFSFTLPLCRGLR